MKVPIYYNKWWIGARKAITFFVVGHFPFLIFKYDDFDRQPTPRADGACTHEWLASTRDDVLCICSKCGAETPRHLS